MEEEEEEGEEEEEEEGRRKTLKGTPARLRSLHLLNEATGVTLGTSEGRR